MPVTTRRSFVQTKEALKTNSISVTNSVVAVQGTIQDEGNQREEQDRKTAPASSSSLAEPRIVTPDLKESKRTTRRKRQIQSSLGDDDDASPTKRPRRGRPRKLESSSAAEAREDSALLSENSGTSEAPSIQAPTGWMEIYALVEELRKDRTAPCDHSGCEALGADAGDPQTRRFITLVALMLSSQTKDAVVRGAIQLMKDDNVLNVRAILDMDRTKLTDYYLKSVGFRNNKAKYLQEACQILVDEYDGDIPPTAAKMMELPGVGPKMAYICENAAWDQCSGIGVDTHMHRLFNLLGWTRKNAKTPEQTRIDLEAWLPRDYWKDVNLLWVGFGQEVQQEKEKIIRKAILCSKPREALRLLQKCGLNVRKESKRYGLEEQISAILSNDTDKN